ncbi:hypothetical protein [Natrialba sp. INN-245]|uniref:hypothetical protein n=1 Tax=Natrialba sp. INN-245 TaxID=2690967 RepID=UPI0013126BAF|nr:hypothetical protein [Natrialba sp. INN-245]MWV38831.1 hypothetical protein [Natrialba sp. INN-245]
MAPASQKPDVERITNRYIQAWEIFGEDRFSTDDLEKELLRKKDPEDVPDSNKIYQDLYRTTMLGLVKWFGEGTYQVAISPKAGESDWDNLVTNQIDWVQSEVNNRIEERREDQAEEKKDDPDGPEIIEYNGKNYLSAFVGPQSDIDGQARYYQAALKPSAHDGVVLRAYQDVADSAEKLSKEITDDDEISNTVCVYRFEVSDMKMEETDDDMEYRIYLGETKLL